MTNAPTLTVATVCKNSPGHLAQTIESVLSQDYPDFQYIVIDGGSTDATLDVLAHYAEQIDVLVSEPDTGIADAMNKAVVKSAGDYILFIHADDRLISTNALTTIAEWIGRDNWCHDIYAFSIFFGDESPSHKRKSRGFTPWLYLRYGIFHQGAVTRIAAFKRFGLFDTTYVIASDYAWALNCYAKGGTTLVIDQPIALMGSSGISSQKDWPSLRKRFAEEERIHLSRAGTSPLRTLYRAGWRLYRAYRWLSCRGAETYSAIVACLTPRK